MHDPKTTIFVRIGNELFSKRLDNSIPQKIKTFTTPIDFFRKIDNDIYIGLEEVDTSPDNSTGPYNNPFTQEWVIKDNSDTLTAVTPGTIKKLLNQNISSLSSPIAQESYYTQEVATGGAKIMYWNKKTNGIKQIGFLDHKLLKTQTCEVGDNCLSETYPECFVPSPDKTLLLSTTGCDKPTDTPGAHTSKVQGGGLGTDVVVITPDGKKSFDRDFYAYTKSYSWVKENILSDNSTFYKIDANGQGDKAITSYDYLPPLLANTSQIDNVKSPYLFSESSGKALILYTDYLRAPYELSQWVQFGDSSVIEGRRSDLEYSFNKNQSKILYYNKYSQVVGEFKEYFYSPNIQVLDIDGKITATIAMFKDIQPANEDNLIRFDAVLR